MRKSISDGVCVEASLVIGALEGDGAAQALFARWRQEGKELVAPVLLDYELLHWLWRIGQESGECLSKYQAMGIELFHGRAVRQLASRFAMGKEALPWRDSIYVATAYILACDLWSRDPGFVERARKRWEWVYLFDNGDTKV
ncbi:MAG: type II toxin-antitoxin system VapC family toxin [Bacillota bacterium]